MARQRAQPDDEDYYLVLGDLGGDKYIVRMYVGAATFDQEFDVTLTDLDKTVTKRMGELARKPDKKLAVEAERPHTHPGHAVALP